LAFALTPFARLIAQGDRATIESASATTRDGGRRSVAYYCTAAYTNGLVLDIAEVSPPSSL
jgi:hypothetical protein